MFGRGLGDTYAVFLVPLEREFGWSRSELTGVYSIYLLVNGFTAPLVGLVFDRFGPRWVYGTGLACLGAGFLCAAGIVSLWQFYLFVGAMVGIGVSFNGMVPASALLSRWYPARLSTAIGIAYSTPGIGTLLFVPLAQSLIAAQGWRDAYRALGIALLVLVPVAMLALPWRRFMPAAAEERRARDKAAGGGWTLETLRTWVEHVIACFGWNRVVWGSDSPVCTLQSSLTEWVAATLALTEGASADERAALYAGNARRIWGLG